MMLVCRVTLPTTAMSVKTPEAKPVHKIIELVGTSPTSWEDAARAAVETAAKTMRDLRIAEVTRLDMKIEDGKVVAYRARVSMSFKDND